MWVTFLPHQLFPVVCFYCLPPALNDHLKQNHPNENKENLSSKFSPCLMYFHETPTLCTCIKRSPTITCIWKLLRNHIHKLTDLLCVQFFTNFVFVIASKQTTGGGLSNEQVLQTKTPTASLQLLQNPQRGVQACNHVCR